MRIFGAGPLEIILILIVVLILFGYKALPRLSKQIGRGLGNLRRGIDAGKEKVDARYQALEEERAAEEADKTAERPAQADEASKGTRAEDAETRDTEEGE